MEEEVRVLNESCANYTSVVEVTTALTVTLETLVSNANEWNLAVNAGGLACAFVPLQFCDFVDDCFLSFESCVGA